MLHLEIKRCKLQVLQHQDVNLVAEKALISQLHEQRVVVATQG